MLQETSTLQLLANIIVLATIAVLDLHRGVTAERTRIIGVV
jgi:hypothetical protein